MTDGNASKENDLFYQKPTFHLVLAKFFLMFSATDRAMFSCLAVSPHILRQQKNGREWASKHATRQQKLTVEVEAVTSNLFLFSFCSYQVYGSTLQLGSHPVLSNKDTLARHPPALLLSLHCMFRTFWSDYVRWQHTASVFTHIDFWILHMDFALSLTGGTPTHAHSASFNSMPPPLAHKTKTSTTQEIICWGLIQLTREISHCMLWIDETTVLPWNINTTLATYQGCFKQSSQLDLFLESTINNRLMKSFAGLREYKKKDGSCVMSRAD